jgi:hypothetical protein
MADQVSLEAASWLDFESSSNNDREPPVSKSGHLVISIFCPRAAVRHAIWRPDVLAAARRRR